MKLFRFRSLDESQDLQESLAERMVQGWTNRLKGNEGEESIGPIPSDDLKDTQPPEESSEDLKA